MWSRVPLTIVCFPLQARELIILLKLFAGDESVEGQGKSCFIEQNPWGEVEGQLIAEGGFGTLRTSSP